MKQPLDMRFSVSTKLGFLIERLLLSLTQITLLLSVKKGFQRSVLAMCMFDILAQRAYQLCIVSLQSYTPCVVMRGSAFSIPFYSQRQSFVTRLFDMPLSHLLYHEFFETNLPSWQHFGRTFAYIFIASRSFFTIGYHHNCQHITNIFFFVVRCFYIQY